MSNPAYPHVWRVCVNTVDGWDAFNTRFDDKEACEETAQEQREKFKREAAAVEYVPMPEAEEAFRKGWEACHKAAVDALMDYIGGGDITDKIKLLKMPEK